MQIRIQIYYILSYMDGQVWSSVARCNSNSTYMSRYDDRAVLKATGARLLHIGNTL